MNSRQYRIKNFVMFNGERYCLLVNKQNGLPLYYPNLFLITQVRNRSLSSSTMESTLASLKVFIAFTEFNGIDLQKRFLRRLFLQPYEMDAIRDYCHYDFSHDDHSVSLDHQKQSLNKLNHRKKIKNRQTGLANTYNRLTHIAQYSKWLAESLLSTNTDKDVALEIEKMYLGLKSRRPPKKHRNQVEIEKGLSKDQIDILLEVVRPGSARNPFDDPAIQVRNYVLILILLHLGIRGGELLNIRISDINFPSNQIVIARRADEKNDPRINQPLVKTLDRRLPIKPTLVKELYDYILKYRRNVPGAVKHQYLLVTHKAGSTQGQPMSRSAYVKLINIISCAAPELSTLTGHALRHTWNDSFSRLMDEMDNPPSAADQEMQRSYLQGWKQGSGSAATYNKRHTRTKAFEAGLKLQAGMTRIPRNLKNVKSE